MDNLTIYSVLSQLSTSMNKEGANLYEMIHELNEEKYNKIYKDLSNYNKGLCDWGSIERDWNDVEVFLTNYHDYESYEAFKSTRLVAEVVLEVPSLEYINFFKVGKPSGRSGGMRGIFSHESFIHKPVFANEKTLKSWRWEFRNIYLERGGAKNKILILSDLGLKIFPKEAEFFMTKPERIKRIDFYNNEVNSIEEFLNKNKFIGLIKLNLCKNKIKKITDKSFSADLKKLKILYLDKNPIEKIAKEAFKNLKNLRILVLPKHLKDRFNRKNLDVSEKCHIVFESSESFLECDPKDVKRVLLKTDPNDKKLREKLEDSIKESLDENDESEITYNIC